MKTAIVYDRINKWGGAEKVLLALHEIFPDASLYTSVYASSKAPWASVFSQVTPSFLQRIPFMQDKHELLGWLTPLAFEQFNFDEYELVISVTSEAAKGIITKPKTLHICYCLTPTRYLWSHYETYFKEGIFRVLTKPLVNYLRMWDKVASRRPDVMVSISNEVKNRVERYYDRESEVIFPPVDVEKFQTSKLPNFWTIKLLKKLEIEKENYYLLVSRLVSYKRVNLALEAFSALNLPLVVVGTGREENKYKQKYGKRKNIKFIGFTSENEITVLFQNAKAFVFPGEEDFGIVMVEALASGIPVIAFKKGGSLDIVEDGKTGILFEEQTKEGLMSAVKKFQKKKFNRNRIQESAEKFSQKHFKNGISELIKRSLEEMK